MPLINRREMFRMILVHCCVHGQAPKYLCELFQTNRNFGQRVTHWKEKLHIVPVHTNFEKNGHLLQRGASMEYIIKFFTAKQSFHFYNICMCLSVTVQLISMLALASSTDSIFYCIFVVNVQDSRKTSLWLREH